MSREIHAPKTYRNSKRKIPACRHTPCPPGYVEWHEWAEKKAKTHDQHRCPTCGGWAIWRKREEAGA